MRNRIRSILICTAISSLVSLGFAGQPETSLELNIYVYNYAAVPDEVLQLAEDAATKVYTEAGVSVRWSGCPISPDERDRYPDCRAPFGPRDLFVRILPTAPEQFAQAQLIFGSARMSSGSGFATVADIYWDRLEEMTWQRLLSASAGIFASQIPLTICRAVPLGVVLAHETGHLLLGTNSHSSVGIMRLNWDRQGLEEAYLGRQRFTRRQVKRLRADIERRAAAEGAKRAD